MYALVFYIFVDLEKPIKFNNYSILPWYIFGININYYIHIDYNNNLKLNM